MTEGDIAGLAILCIFGLPVVGWILIRFMQHSERMAMIKRGIADTPADPTQSLLVLSGRPLCERGIHCHYALLQVKL